MARTNIKIPRCKLRTSIQKQLINLFMSGCTARAAARIMSVNRNTTMLFFRKLRLIIQSSLNEQLMSGIVEVDETYLSSGKGGRKAAKKGRNIDGKIALVGAVERCSMRVHIERVYSTTAATIEGFVRRNIAPNAVVHTDSFRSYNHINRFGYKHKRVNHFLTFKNSKTLACTNLIESVWAASKRFLVRFAGGWRNNLNLWLAELCFRFEHRNNFCNEMRRILRRATRLWLPVPPRRSGGRFLFFGNF